MREWFDYLKAILFIPITFYFGPLSFFKRYKFFKKLIKTNGVIVSLYSGDRSYETYARVCYSLDGKTYENSVYWIPSVIWKDEGKHIKVYIDPNDVNKIYVKQFRDESFEVALLCTVFFLLITFTFVMICVRLL